MAAKRFSINGHDGETAPPKNVCAVQIFRVMTDAPEFVRLLTEEYGGCFTHFHRGRSEYCCGDACRIPSHHVERTWKGYCPALVLLRGPKPIWAPICLEITESCELDFRDVFRRGQLWELYRERRNEKKFSIVGKLHEDPAPANLPRPFDIIPALRALYHRDIIDLRHPSPIPPRVFVEEFQGDLPDVLKPKRDDEDFKPGTGYSMAEEFRKKAQQRAAESANGRAGKK